MKISLLSDTHGYLDDAILKLCSSGDEIWHAGDWGGNVAEPLESQGKKLRGVYGNIDGRQIRSLYPEKNIFDIGGIKVVMIHIGGYPGRYSKGITDILDTEKAELFISGHSHILKVMPDKRRNLLHINPGAAGKHGFHKMRTMLQFEIKSGQIKNLNAIELGPRAKI